MKVASEKEPRNAFRTARTEAKAAFGNEVYMEKHLPQAASHRGAGPATARAAAHLAERDCSLQRRHQKVLVEPRPWRSAPRSAPGSAGSGQGDRRDGPFRRWHTEFLYEDGGFLTSSR
ncbi:MAG: hypothetical protein R3D59_11465 [Paracoccaceae bacterium]